MKTIAYSPWGTGTQVGFLDKIFARSINAKSHGFTDADAFVLWGGQDIHPSYYGQRRGPNSQAWDKPTERDIWEWQAMKYCKANNIPIIGICRGAQFMCAFSGGKLIQHVNNHTGADHPVVCADGEMFDVTSCHHQMLDLTDTDGELLAWTPTNRSTVYYGQSAETPEHLQQALVTGTFKEPEIVYFPGINGLAIQGHPEWANINGPFVKKCLDYINLYLLEEVTV